MTSAATHIAAAVAGLAIIASPLMVTRRGLLPRLLAALTLGLIAAALIHAIA